MRIGDRGRRTAEFLLWILLAGCDAPGPPGEPSEAQRSATRELFTDQTARAGLDFVHVNGMLGEYHMAELMGSGGALFDVDNDGDLDLYLVQGSALEAATGEPRPAAGLSDRLFRNDSAPGGPPRFTDVTAGSGLETIATGYGMGVAAGDVDNDGWCDLYVTEYGANRLLRNSNRLLRNLGTAPPRFEDITVEAGAGDPRWSVPATFVDIDRDGWLDLLIGNYLDHDHPSSPRCAGPSGARDYCGAGHFPPAADRLLRNLGPDADGRIRFEDVTARAGLTAVQAGRTLGALAADFDGDGWPDLYVANDAGPNHFWRHLGATEPGGRFTEEALLNGTALNSAGQAEASMGIDAADPDRDGDLDLFLTHLVVETNTFYSQRAPSPAGGAFEDRTAAAGLGPPSRTHTAFGTAFLDFDNDGWLDLLTANGAVQNIPALVRAGDPHPLHETNQLFHHLGPEARGGAEYRDVSAHAGQAFEPSEVSRGAIFGDIDNDGDPDVVITNNNGPARLLINAVGQERAWIGLRLTTGEPPRDALGAWAGLTLASGEVRWDRVASDGSYASANDPRVVFGLGSGTKVGGVRVRWPDGTWEEFPPPPIQRYTTLSQGHSGVSAQGHSG